MLGVVGYLVGKAEPAPDFGCGGRGGELANGIKIFWEWLNRRVGYPEAIEEDASLCELKLIWVQDDACLTNSCE